jgi:hypothetical protein
VNGKIIIAASALIAVLATVAAGAGLFWSGLYANDTQSMAVMAMGNDLVTLVLCVPLLLVSAYYAAKGSLRGRLAWTGTVFYFLYTYAMACFVVAYNQLFMVYVAIGSLSLFVLAASLLTLDAGHVKESLSRAPVRATAVFMFLVGLTLSAQWLGLIVPSVISGQRPALLETYTTLVAQAMDLGILVPLGILTGTLLLKRSAWGYVLASVFLVKGVTYGTAVLSMALFQHLNGIEVPLPFALAIAGLVACALALAVAYYGRMEAPAAARKAAIV